MCPTPHSVNMPLTRSCNYNCRFCFGHLRGLDKYFDPSRILEIPILLSEVGTEKITLEGGEPFLSPHLLPLLKVSRRVGLKTCIVTNGSLITKRKLIELKPYLDWIGISIDSKHPEIEKWLGRGKEGHIDQVKRVLRWCHELGIKLKVNTVVTRCSYQEDMIDLIRELNPDIWKVMQVLEVKTENEDQIGDLKITDEQFRKFIELNQDITKYGIEFKPEFNHQMYGSYIMILPSGHFFNNNNGRYQISKDSIFDIGVIQALSEVDWDYGKFRERGGIYAY